MKNGSENSTFYILHSEFIYMNLQKKKQLRIARRKARVQVSGTADKPRFSVYRSLKGIYAQIINDETGKTLVSASSKDIKANKMKKAEIAAEVGKLLSERAKEKNISRVVFDRGSAKYHGRIKALADGAREGGLRF